MGVVLLGRHLQGHVHLLTGSLLLEGHRVGVDRRVVLVLIVRLNVLQALVLVVRLQLVRQHLDEVTALRRMRRNECLHREGLSPGILWGLLDWRRLLVEQLFACVVRLMVALVFPHFWPP